MSFGMRRTVVKHSMGITVQNASNSPCTIDFYLCKWRRSEGTQGELRLEQKLANAMTAQSVPAYPDLNPYNLTKFVEEIKILSHWKKSLGQGESTFARCKSPITGTKGFSQLTDEPINEKYTRGILMIARGIPVHDVASISQVNCGPCSLNVKAVVRSAYRLCSNTTQTTEMVTHPGTVTTAEIPVGNANDPTNYIT